MEKMRAQFYLTTAYLKGDQETKNAVAGLILSLLSAPMAEHELWNAEQSPRAAACIIAGHAGISAAVPVLIKLLKPLPGQGAAHNLWQPVGVSQHILTVDDRWLGLAAWRAAFGLSILGRFAMSWHGRKGSVNIS